MIDITFDVDYKKLDKVILEYSAASGKDLVDSSNRFLQQACIKSIKHAKNADASAISSLFQKEKLIWWLAHKLRREQRSGGVYDAREKALNNIRRRIKSISFIKIFFKIASNMLARFTGNFSNKPQSGRLSGFMPFVKPAVSGDYAAKVGVTFTSNKYSVKDQQKVETILYTALQNGIADTVTDMQEHITRKFRETAQLFSGGK